MKKKTGFRDSLSTVHRSLFTLLTLFLLAALAPQAQAQVKITGGITNKYRLSGVTYYSHTFTNTQAITVLGDVDVTCLSVAGGGGGALHNGDPTGGGGAGGFLTGTVTLVSTASYTVNVGAGGLGCNNGAEGSGSDGAFSYVTNTSAGGVALMLAFGGGGGGDWENGHVGGSGGGGSDHNPGSGACKGGASTNGQGNAGANTAGGKGSGGGAGSAGINGSGVAGGSGRASTLRDGYTAVTFAAGGECTASTRSGTDALPNTGNGGGNGIRGDSAYRGGNGGSGIVTLRYVDSSTHDPTVTVVNATAIWAVTNAAFRVFRPSTDPGNLDYTIPFTLSGTATNGTDYAKAPSTNFNNSGALIGAVTIPAGQMSAVVNLYPLYTLSSVQKQATLTLDGSDASSDANATVTFPAWPAASKWAAATGGNTTTNYTLGSAPNATNYAVLVFTNSGTLTVTSGGQIEYLFVAGGGGGAGYNNKGGGGGAGGFLTGLVSLVSGSYAVSVGFGGAGGVDGATIIGSIGTNSALGGYAICAFGGGWGTAYGYGGAGGSGGGASFLTGATGGAGVPGQGNKGGDAQNGVNTAAGGGGAGGPGANAASGQPAAGGNGLQSSLRDGVTAVTYAAGGKGRGGGISATNGEDGGDNTGNGGGGSIGSGTRGGYGGSGIVIVRYVVPPPPKGTVIMMR